MSSNAVAPASIAAPWRLAAAMAMTFGALAGSPLAAQDGPESDDDERSTSREVIDLTVTVLKAESDRLLMEDCEEANDAGIIANEIVICRRRGEATDGSWNREQWERDYARRTQGGGTPDVAGDGIFRGAPSVSGLCLIPPCPDEAAIMIDVEALPEAPKGSDADRIARGLPPSGRSEEPSPEKIARRRRALGLEAPPIPEE